MATKRKENFDLIGEGILDCTKKITKEDEHAALKKALELMNTGSSTECFRRKYSSLTTLKT